MSCIFISWQSALSGKNDGTFNSACHIRDGVRQPVPFWMAKFPDLLSSKLTNIKTFILPYSLKVAHLSLSVGAGCPAFAGLKDKHYQPQLISAVAN